MGSKVVGHILAGVPAHRSAHLQRGALTSNSKIQIRKTGGKMKTILIFFGGKIQKLAGNYLNFLAGSQSHSAVTQPVTHSEMARD